jgi:hypothetical protein
MGDILRDHTERIGKSMLRLPERHTVPLLALQILTRGPLERGNEQGGTLSGGRS